ncbi:MAG: Zn-ribbon containing protein, partial [Natronomonas sp.]
MPHQCTGCGHTFPDGSKEMLSGCPDCGGNTFQFRPEGSSADQPADADLESSDPPEPPGDSDPADGGVAETVGRATTRVRDFVSGEPSDTPNPDAEWPSEDSRSDDGSRSPDTAPSAGTQPAGSDTPTAHSDAETGNAETGTETDAETIESDHEPTGGEEDTAQASARTDVVEPSDLPSDANRNDSPYPVSSDSDSQSRSRDDARSRDKPHPDDGTVVSEPSGDDPDIDDLREQLNDQFESIKIVEPGEYELNLMELYDREEY